MEKLVFELKRQCAPDYTVELSLSIYYNNDTKGFRIETGEFIDGVKYNIFEVHLTEEDRCGIVASLLVQREEFFLLNYFTDFTR